MDAINLKVDSPLAAPPPPAQPQQQQEPPPTNGAGGNGQATVEPSPPPQAAPEAVPQAEPLPPEPPPEPWVTNEDGKVKLRLRKMVEAHGEKVKYLTFKEPTGGDIERIGNPVTVGGGVFNFDSTIMTNMMSHLAGVPTSTIRNLHSKDWSNGAYSIWGFFVPDA